VNVIKQQGPSGTPSWPGSMDKPLSRCSVVVYNYACIYF